MNTATTHNLVDFQEAWRERFGSNLPPPLGRPLEKFLGIRRLNRRYAANQKVLPLASPTPSFWRALLSSWDIDYKVAAEELQNIPVEGPLLLVANHPFGFVDGLILCALLAQRRPDLRLIANRHLGNLPELQGMVLPVNNYGGPEAARNNQLSLRETLRHLKSGGAVATFPAGEVSSLKTGVGICDGPWHPNTVRLAKMTKATVVPVYFHGSNGPLFHALGLLNPSFRTALLPREFLRTCGRTVKVRIGQPVSLAKFGEQDAEEAANFLRARTYALSARPETGGAHMTRDYLIPATSRNAASSPSFSKDAKLSPIAPPEEVSEMASEIASLPPEDTLLVQGNFRVFISPAWHIPITMRQIGRERERAFRMVGEGTGKPSDLDSFDRHYLHLVVWDEENHALAGAYRVGRTDVILRHLGLKGLYTNGLFRYKAEFFDKTGPCLELGRSFVAPEYQRKPQPLHLLWRGLGEYVLRHPRYRKFLGPVSMSADYEPSARSLVTAALSSKWSDQELRKLVSPLHPASKRDLPAGLAGVLIPSLDDEADLSSLVSTIQPDNVGIPILLKHYLKLNAKVVACNVDPDFGQCLDALIVVDLLKADPKTTARYLGDAGIETLRSHHKAS